MPDTQKPTAALLARLLAGRAITRVEHCLDTHCAGHYDIYRCASGEIIFDYYDENAPYPGVELYASQAAYDGGAHPCEALYIGEAP